MKSAENIETLRVVKWRRSFEVVFKILVEIFSLCVVYIIFKFIGEWITDGKFDTDILLSVVVLPAIYILKDSYQIFTPFSVTVTLSDNEVTVKKGIFTQHLDCLKLTTVENIESVTTVLGKHNNYGTLHLYSYGAGIDMPNIKDVGKIRSKIEAALKQLAV